MNSIALFTLTRREMVRSLKIINQVIWPPVITTLLYVFVFGLALGSRIQSVQGVSYSQFLVPGLIMLQVIEQTYGEGSSTVFQGRWMNSIQELLIAPLSAFEMVMGYVVAGVARALFIALLITALGAVVVRTLPVNWVLYFATIVLVAILFASVGIICGLFAEKFDHIALLTTFFILEAWMPAVVRFLDDRGIVLHFDAVPISEADRLKIGRTNAIRLFKLQQRSRRRRWRSARYENRGCG